MLVNTGVCKLPFPSQISAFTTLRPGIAYFKMFLAQNICDMPIYYFILYLSTYFKSVPWPSGKAPAPNDPLLALPADELKPKRV